VRLSLKISAATALGICVILITHGYTRVNREIALFESDVQSDHRLLGRAVAIMASAATDRMGAERGLEIVEDLNFRESRVEIKWISDASAPPTATSTTVRREDHQGSSAVLVTRVSARVAGPGFIQLRESLQPISLYARETASRTAFITLALIASSSAIIFGLGWLLLGRPLRLVMAQAASIGAGELAARLHLPQHDEMGELAREMNTMSERLAQSQETARLEASGRIAALQQLRHADRVTTVGKLASGVAHELGTPLNVVAARAQMIERGESEGAAAQNDARIIREQTARMTKIIRELLDFARARKPHTGVHDLTAIAATTLEMLSSIAQRHNVSLIKDPDARPVLARVDAAQVQQIVTNLVMNAIQAEPSEGEVRVHTCARCPALPNHPEVDPKPYACLIVEDDGLGIAPDVLDRIFEPFFTTKDVGEGTGLGLSVVYGIVEEHGGVIDVISEQGRGTTVYVALPRVNAGQS
jgi:two-component system, NtrC family, sensor kinase